MVSRVLVASVVAGIAGCYDPAPEEGVPCASATSELRCPTGLQCILRQGREVCATGLADGVDAGIVDAPPGVTDRDGDGVDDDRDVCPDLADPKQRDEDRDGVGDLCDPCPPLVGNADADGDGVGDACDPNPAVAGDKLVVFEGFDGPMSAGWTISGMFSASGGEGVAIAGDNQSVLVTIPSPTAPRVEIRALATLASITSTGDFLGAAGLVERLAAGTDKGMTCQLARLPDATSQQLRIFNTDTGATVDTAAHTFAVGVASELRLRRDGNRYACRATNPVLELAATPVAAIPATPRIGIRVRSAVVSFRWVMVVSSP